MKEQAIPFTVSWNLTALCTEAEAVPICATKNP
jgi:hypothetical protein